MLPLRPNFSLVTVIVSYGAAQTNMRFIINETSEAEGTADHVILLRLLSFFLVCLPDYLSVYLSAHLSVTMFVCLSVFFLAFFSLPFMDLFADFLLLSFSVSY